MIEWCSFRRMICCIILFSIISALVFIIESRLEESVSSGDTVLKKLATWRISEAPNYANSLLNISHPRNVALNTSQKISEMKKWPLDNYSSVPSNALCYTNEPFTVIEECVKCSSFEVDALRVEYCVESGYYDRLNCTSSGRLGLRPCYSRGDYASVRFNRMMFSWILLAIASYTFVTWRRGILDRRAYVRVQQQLAS